MKNRIKFSKAINNALKFSLKKDKNLIVYGLGVTDPKEIFDTTKNLKKEFGSNRVFDIPNSETTWSLIGNDKLTDQTPIKLSWTNNQNITFEKEISLDDKFLFTIKQKVTNSTNKKYDFY